MRVRIVSDIHMEFFNNGYMPNLGQGDVLLLAGDTFVSEYIQKDVEMYNKFLKYCKDNFNYVVAIMGNHEYYFGKWDSVYNEVRGLMNENNITLLENETVTIGNWLFMGCTLWTDLDNQNVLARMAAFQSMNDYRVIKKDKKTCLKPDDTVIKNLESRQFLQNTVADNKGKKIFIMTHHAPSRKSIDDRYTNQYLNAAYSNDLESFIIDNPEIKFWIHGHTHHSFDYYISQCRVICNPLGYFNTSDMNSEFNSKKMVEIC